MTFGEELKAARKKVGMTQEEVAHQVQTTKTAISRYEKNQRLPRSDIFTRLCIVLDIDADKMVNLATLADFTAPQLSASIHNLLDWKFEEIEPLKKSDRDNNELNIVNNSHKKRIDYAFGRLNEDGQEIAAQRIEELAEIPKYQKLESEEVLRDTLHDKK